LLVKDVKLKKHNYNCMFSQRISR